MRKVKAIASKNTKSLILNRNSSLEPPVGSSHGTNLDFEMNIGNWPCLSIEPKYNNEGYTSKPKTEIDSSIIDNLNYGVSRQVTS